MFTRELILILLGLVTGAMMLAWAGWNIVNYVRADREGRHKRRFYFRIALFFGFVGLADLSKAIQSLFVFLAPLL